LLAHTGDDDGEVVHLTSACMVGLTPAMKHLKGKKGAARGGKSKTACPGVRSYISVKTERTVDVQPLKKTPERCNQKNREETQGEGGQN